MNQMEMELSKVMDMSKISLGKKLALDDLYQAMMNNGYWLDEIVEDDDELTFVYYNGKEYRNFNLWSKEREKEAYNSTLEERIIKGSHLDKCGLYSSEYLSPSHEYYGFKDLVSFEGKKLKVKDGKLVRKENGVEVVGETLSRVEFEDVEELHKDVMELLKYNLPVHRVTIGSESVHGVLLWWVNKLRELEDKYIKF